MISIHALCEEGDRPMSARRHAVTFLSTPSARRATSGRGAAIARNGDFYPRPLRGGRLDPPPRFQPPFEISIHALCEEGDSPLPMGRYAVKYFYPRPLRGGRPSSSNAPPWTPQISIHALCEEGDRREIIPNTNHNTFLSTPSARRATQNVESTVECLTISIHALCEEGDI